MDETFAKLIEAEELEEALEEKREQSASNIKAQLAARRNAKRHKQEDHTMADSSESGSDVRVTKTKVVHELILCLARYFGAGYFG